MCFSLRKTPYFNIHRIALVKQSCSDRILTCRIKSIRSPAKVGLVVTDLITSPVVSWEGWETPPPPTRQHRGSAVILCSTTGVVRPLCSCGDLLLSSARLLFTFGGCVTGILSLVLSIFFSFFLLDLFIMSKELRICPGVGARKCGAFLARLDRDPHPTCTRCRGRICTKDMTCDFCAVWSAEQWALFVKKRSYKERKHRPSGSAPPAQQTSPRAETSSGVSCHGTSSSSSSRPLGGQERGEGSQGAPGVVSGGAPSPPARPRSSERGGSASRHLSGVSGLASSSPSPSGGGGAGVARSRQTSHSRVSESVDSPSFSPHVPRRENVRESSGSCSRALSSRDSRSSVREPRKDKRARSREVSSRGRRRLSRSRSSSRSRSRGRERVRRSSSASRSSRGRSRRERSRSSDRYRSRRGSSRSRRDRSRSSD